MSSAKTEVFNMALANVGSTEFLASDTETNHVANLCNLFYEQSRQFVLRDFPWRFAKRRVALALLAGTPPTCWGFQYSAPGDSLKIRALATPGNRTPLVEQKTPFELASNGAEEVVYTDLEEAECIYTQNIEDLTRWPVDAREALTYHLAAKLALPLRGKEGVQLASSMQSAYAAVVEQAAAANLNEGYDHTPECSFLQARNG